MIFQLINTLKTTDIGKDNQSNLNTKIYLTISSISFFLIPAIIFIYKFHNLKKFFSIRLNNLHYYFIITILIIISIQPLLMLSIKINDLIPLNQYIKNYMMEQKNAIEKMLLNVSIVKQNIDWLVNSIVFCIVPSISEEVLFRGVIQKHILSKYTKNKYMPIIITSIIFSIAHFNFINLIPMFIISSIIGYLYLISKCIWVPIIAHFTNNMLALISIQYYNTNISDSLDYDTPKLSLTILATIVSIYLIYFLSRLSK